MSDSLIDQAIFDELKEATGEEFAAELVLTFLEEATQMLAELKGAIASGDADSYRRAAHSIKSNASTFGATGLAERARKIELGALPDADNTADADALEAEFQLSAQALRSLVDG